MKRIIAFIALALLLLSLSGCFVLSSPDITGTWDVYISMNDNPYFKRQMIITDQNNKAFYGFMYVSSSPDYMWGNVEANGKIKFQVLDGIFVGVANSKHMSGTFTANNIYNGRWYADKR